MAALSTHLDGYCAVEASLEDAAEALRGRLLRFGPVERLDGAGFESTIEQLLPLASFPSRYLLLPRAGWTVVLSNKRSPAAVDVQTTLSRDLHARCVSGFWSARGRMLTVVERGETVRAIVCYREAGWVFHQEGTPEPFEDLARYERHRKSERLPPALVQEYLSQLTGEPVPPNWRALFSGTFIRLQRSTAEVQVEIREYDVDVDV